MHSFKKLLNRINSLVELIVSAMLLVIVGVIFLQVIFRFVLHSSLPWSEELSRYLLVWVSFLGASIGVKRKSHIGVEFLVSLFPKGWKKRAEFFVSAASCVFFATLVIYGRLILRTVGMQLSPAMEISMALPYSSILAGGALMLIYSAFQMAEILTGREAEVS